MRSIFYPLTSFILIILFSTQTLAYDDHIHWWYQNLCGLPGTYMYNGPGVDSSNGAHYNGYYWLGTNFRDGNLVIRRNLSTGTNTIYFGTEPVKTYISAYQTGMEEIVNITFQSTYSAGNLSLNSTSIRYSQSGIWSDWENIDFSHTLPYVQYPSPTQYATKEYRLRSNQGFEIYELKYNVSVPASSDNKQYYIFQTSTDDTSTNYDPLTAPAIPEPLTISLLFLSLCSFIKKFT